jgi:dipeptidyl aminopeptidase/acylaminoacyl peptidase
MLSARLFLEPQLAGDSLVFISNLGGHLSLYSMEVEGGVPQPLLPPRIALQNPELVGGYSFYVLPELERILLLIDRDGDEVYEPYVVPLEGGFPEPVAPGVFSGQRAHIVDVDLDHAVAYVATESLAESMRRGYRVDLRDGTPELLGESPYGAFPMAWTPDHSRIVLADAYTMGDLVLWEPEPGGGWRVLYGVPLDERDAGGEYPLPGFRSLHGVASGAGLLVVTTLFSDTGTLGYVDFERPDEVQPVSLEGLVHEGAGELEAVQHLDGDRYALRFNVDGCSWAYEARLDESDRRLETGRVLVGQGELADGVLHGLHYEKESRRFALSFCTATMPTQLYVLDADGSAPARKTRERPLGVDPGLLSAGEDASFESHDGLRVSARLYLPSPELGFSGPRPLVYYVHGGPQSQERPNFAWFSMPLIQMLALEGFAVFVPNARGSTGYGLSYSKRVDRDWGGQDRLDHVHAMTEILPHDGRIDVDRAGVVGRSYGGYMTLMLAGRHPELWRAAVDMFGPYDLITFSERIPETWKPYFALAMGDPERDADLLVERSPRTTIADLSCPLLVIQGQNDPRVVERESRDLVEGLRELGKEVDYLVFEDEGHDVLKLANRVRCYETIVSFFSEHLA